MKPVTLPGKQFIAEHAHLVKVLKSGTPGERQAEAAKQGAELKPRLVKPPYHRRPSDTWVHSSHKPGRG